MENPIKLEPWQEEMKAEGYAAETYMSDEQIAAREARWNRGEFTDSEKIQNELTAQYKAENEERKRIEREKAEEERRKKCRDSAIETGMTVGGVMGTTAGLMALVGGVIGAPLTGGATLALAATAVGGLSGIAAAGTRQAFGKECRSPALDDIQKVNEIATMPLDPGGTAYKAAKAVGIVPYDLI